jgi:hypothetical protein
MVWVSWGYYENLAAGKNVNVAVAAYVNTHIGLNLDE